MLYTLYTLFVYLFEFTSTAISLSHLMIIKNDVKSVPGINVCIPMPLLMSRPPNKWNEIATETERDERFETICSLIRTMI